MYLGSTLVRNRRINSHAMKKTSPIKALDHVAIAVHKIHDHLPIYTEKLGIPCEGIYTIKAYGVRIASLKLRNSRIELMEPMGPKSILKGFLDKKGEGIAHIAFKVRGLEKCISNLKDRGMLWIGDKPRKGLHNSQICFLHRSSTKGILLEFVE
jgi:methylmalonyl-CoA/ethylmalonyl-CoA epimerase